MKDKVSILVLSCDKYKDLWPIFDFFFKKNWENSYLKKYFLSNNEKNVPKGFKSISVGKDISWSNNLDLALNDIDTPYVFLLLDDAFINNKIDNEKLEKIFSDFEDNKGNYLKFISQPKSPYKTKSPFFNELPKGSLYRSTAVFAIWKVNVLKKILKSDENAWEFEEFGSIRSDNFSNFFVVNNDFFKNPIHGVVKGEFLFNTYNLFKKKYPELLPLIKREVNGRNGKIRQAQINLRHKLFYALVPLTKRRAVKSFFQKFF
mgnify:CR=1 FL=1|tara:strand:- start:1950 stop:2732 length:783 start_codon:yes stop_codon:yes gene_type:complete